MHKKKLQRSEMKNRIYETNKPSLRNTAQLMAVVSALSIGALTYQVRSVNMAEAGFADSLIAKIEQTPESYRIPKNAIIELECKRLKIPINYCSYVKAVQESTAGQKLSAEEQKIIWEDSIRAHQMERSYTFD
jgi:hypothetical protein